MSDLSEDDDSMEEDSSGEDEDSSGEEESAGESEVGSDSESADEENHSKMNDSENVQQQELSSSSDEASERDRCPICLNRFIGQDLGIPENCEHIFCFECINEWGSNINTCPIDRNEFHFVHLKRSPDGKVLRKVRVRVRSKEPEEGTVAEDVTQCEVCHMGDREHRLLLCDACDLAYHCDCLDPPLFHIPIEEWFCPPCASIMTQMGDRALPSTSRSRRVIPRTRASESVRVRVQNRRTYPSTNSRSTSTPRPKKRKRRTYRRCIRKVVNLARTKAAGSSGKGGKAGRATAVMVTYRKKYKRRKRRKTKKTSRKTRLPSASAESNLQSAKERIAKRLGLCKTRTGTAIPDVRSKAGPSSGGSSSDRTHSLFGARDQLMDFSENFNEDMAVPSTSSSTPRNLPRRSEATAAPSNFLDSILAGQELLHAKSDSLIIRNDGSLIRKEGEKKKAVKGTSNTSKSVVRVGLCKPDVASKHAAPEKARASSVSLLHGALTKKKSSESRSNPQQKPGTSSHNSTIDVSEKTRMVKKQDGKQSAIEGSSRLSKKSSDLFSKHREKPKASSSIDPSFGSKNLLKTDKPKDKHVSSKGSSSALHNTPATKSCDTYLESKPTGLSNLSDNKKQSEKSQKAKSSNVQDTVPNHRLDILQKRASFLQKFNTKSTASAIKELFGDSSRNQPSGESTTLATTDYGQKLSDGSLAAKSTYPQTNEIKIKDEPLSSDEDEVHSESLIGHADKFYSGTLKTEFQDSESLIGNFGTDQFSPTTLNTSITMKSPELRVVKPTFIKKEPVSSDEESISPMSGNHELFGCRARIKEMPEASDEDIPNDLPFTHAAGSLEDLPCTQAVERFDDLPCTQAVKPFEGLPCTQAAGSFDDLPCTQAAGSFDDLPCTQAAGSFDDLPCTQAAGSFDDLPCTQAAGSFDDLPCTQAAGSFEDLPYTQAVERFDDLPCTQAVKPFKDLPCTQAAEPFEDLPCTQVAGSFEDLPCTQAVEHFDDLPCTQAVKPFEDLPCTQAAEPFEDLPCTQAAGCFEDLPCTQAAGSFEDLPCTQAVEHFDDLPCTQAVKPFEDLPCTQAAEPFEDLPCTQAAGCFEDLPCTQAAGSFEDLPCTQAVEHFDDLPCTQAVKPFEDLPCTQAAEPFEDLPCTQAAGSFEDLPCTQAAGSFEDLPYTQAAELFEDLPCTQAADIFPNDSVFKVPKSKLPLNDRQRHTSEAFIPSNHSRLNNSNAVVDDSDLPETQSSSQEMSNVSVQESIVSKKFETNNSVPDSKQKDKKVHSLFNAQHLDDDDDLLETKKAIALLRSGCNKVKTPPKVMGVHRNLPQVITSVPARRPLVPKPINKRTFSFEQVKQHFKLEEAQTNNLSDTETNAKLIAQSKSESHLSSDNDSEHVSELRPIKPSTTTPSNNVHSLSYEKHSKGLAGDCKSHRTSSSTLTDSKLIKPPLNKETLHNVSNIKASSNIPQTLLQTDSFTSCYIKKEPLDINEDVVIQNPCIVKKVDEHIGESNLARALRIKREMNAEVLQQNAFKERIVTAKVCKERNIRSSNMSRALTIKQEMNLEVMRENLLQASLESSRHVSSLLENGIPTEHMNDQKVKIEKETFSVRIKTEKDDDLNMNQYLEKNRGICKESVVNAKCIKKEPRERQAKCTKKSDSFDKSLEKNKSDVSSKEGNDKPVKEERNSEKRNKHNKNDNCEERHLKSNNENIYNKRKSKFQDKDRQESKEKFFDENKKKADKDHHSSKEKNYGENKKKVDKDHHSSKERSNKYPVTDQDNIANVSVIKNKCVVKESKIRNSDKKNNCTDGDTPDSKVSISNSKHKPIEKNKHDNMERSSASKNIHTDKHGNKESNFNKKNKHLENYKHDSKEKSDAKNKHVEKCKPDCKDKNSYNQDNNAEKGKHSSRANNYDRKDKNAEKDKHCQNKRVSDSKLNYSEKDHCDAKESKCDRNNKTIHKDRYSDSKTKSSEKDKYNKGNDFVNRHGEKKTHESHAQKESKRRDRTEDFEKNKHPNNENSQTINKKEMSRKRDKVSGATDRLLDGSEIKKEGLSVEGRKRSFEASSIDDNSNQEKKRRKFSKNNLSSSSKSRTSPDSTSGPDTTERLAAFGSSKHDETLLDARIRKMMNHGDFDRSGKKRRHESMCSEETSGCFSDISQLSNEQLVKEELLSFKSPKLEKVEERKHSVSKDTLMEQKSSKDLKEEIAAAIKLILKPFFTVGVVNKEDYKDIMRKAVPKVFLNCGNCVNPEKIKKLVLGYVAKLKNS